MKTLYDISTETAPIAGPIRGGIAGVVIGLLLLAMVWQRRDRAPRVFVLLWIVFWGGLSTYNVLAISRGHREAVAQLARGDTETIEGVVTDLSPPAQNDTLETFRIGEHVFKVHDGSSKVPGLARASIHGGPIRTGAHVKITYRGPSILKVEELP